MRSRRSRAKWRRFQSCGTSFPDAIAVIKRNVKVDWTAPHREDVRAAIRAAVWRALRCRDLHADVIDMFVGRVMAQAEALNAGWPLAA
jgi:type I restriction enzyme, R subunit